MFRYYFRRRFDAAIVYQPPVTIHAIAAYARRRCARYALLQFTQDAAFAAMLDAVPCFSCRHAVDALRACQRSAMMICYATV